MNALTGDGSLSKLNDNKGMFSYDAGYVADAVLRSIVNGDREVIVSVWLHRLVIWLRFFMPQVYFWVMAKRAKSNAKLANPNTRD